MCVCVCVYARVGMSMETYGHNCDNIMLLHKVLYRLNFGYCQVYCLAGVELLVVSTIHE